VRGGGGGGGVLLQKNPGLETGAPPVGGAAKRHDDDHGIFKRRARHDVPRLDVCFEQLQHRTALERKQRAQQQLGCSASGTALQKGEHRSLAACCNLSGKRRP